MSKSLKMAAVAFAFILVATVIFILAGAGTFRSLEVVAPVGVELVEGFGGGTEDVVFAPDGRHAFVSVPHFRDPSTPSSIYVLDTQSRALRDVTPEKFRTAGALQPHGLDIWTDGEVTRLFLVNHPGGSALDHGGDAPRRDTVEIFEVGVDFSLTHLETVEAPEIRTPNDVAAVGPREFYISNDHGYPSGVMRQLEELFKLPAGNIVYFDGERAREVFAGTRYANGIAVSKDGKSLYVAETIGRDVLLFDREPSGDLELVARHATYTGLDNIDVAPDGSLYIGAHPRLLAFVWHASSPAERRSPSEVIRVVPSRDGAWTQEIVYLNDGDPISGSSVAATNGEVVIVGAVFDPRVAMWAITP